MPWNPCRPAVLTRRPMSYLRVSDRQRGKQPWRRAAAQARSELPTTGQAARRSGWWALLRRRRRAAEGDGSVGSAEGDRPVGLEGEGPLSFVDQVVVPFAEREHVGDVGRSLVLPPGDVMDPAGLEAHLAAGMTTGSVHRPKGTALFAGGEASGSAVIEGNAVSAEHDGDDLGVAGESADRRDRQFGPISGLGDGGLMDAVHEGLVVDQHDDFRDPPIRGAGAGDQIDEGVGSEVVEAEVVVVRPCGPLGRRHRRRPRRGRRSPGRARGGCGTSRSDGRSIAAPAAAASTVRGDRCRRHGTGSASTARLPVRTPPPSSWPLIRRGSIRARRAQRDRRRRAVRRRGRAHRHDRPTPCRPPERHGPQASGRTPHLGGPPGERRALPADHRTSTSTRHPHPSPSRPAGWRGWRSARPARRANHAPARTPAPTREVAGSHVAGSARQPTDQCDDINGPCAIVHMFDCQRTTLVRY